MNLAEQAAPEQIAISNATKPSLAGLRARAGRGSARKNRDAGARNPHARFAALALDLLSRRGEFFAMLNVSKVMRQKLDEHFSLTRPEVVEEQVSADGTRKWLIRLAPVDALDKGAEVECVYIPETDRGTLCVSSQVGCTLNCTFCHTGTQKLVRNLTPQEIVAQLIVARQRLGDFPGLVPPDNGLIPSGEGVRAVSNIVFMGMGEPLYNFENVRDAVEILSDGDGLSLSKRRITVSTSGVVPQIERLGAESGAALAISLHAVRDDLRDQLVPLNKKYPIKELLQACRDYPGASNARRITFEYVMLKGVNDSPAEARELVRLLKGIPAKINLIPFNPWPGAPYECSDWDRNREIFRHRVQRRLRQPGPHPARPRHSRGLRPAQERDGKAARARKAGGGIGLSPLDLQMERNIAPRRMAVGADHFVGLFHQFLQFGGGQALRRHFHLDRDAKTAAVARADRDLAGDFGVGNFHLVLRGDEIDRAAKTSGVAGREQMFGRRRTGQAGAAHALAHREIDADRAVLGFGMAVAAAGVVSHGMFQDFDVIGSHLALPRAPKIASHSTFGVSIWLRRAGNFHARRPRFSRRCSIKVLIRLA